MAGLFLKVFGADRPWKRFLADASYWCYLLHLPVVMVLQVLVATLPVNGWLKLGFIVALSVGALLVSYRYLVRYTWLGTALNGPRAPGVPRVALG